MATETLRPSADGTNTEFTFDETGDLGARPYFDSVNEAAKDDYTTYVANATANGYQVDTYEIPDSGVGAGVISSVKVLAYVYGQSGNAKQKIAIHTHATTYYGSEEDVASSWVLISKTWTDNPNTSNAWTWAEINALEAGIALRKISYAPACTQVYVEIDYAPGWVGTVCGVLNPAAVNGVAFANIAGVMGVA